MLELSGGALLHIVGIAVLLVMLIHPKTRSASASSAGVAVVSFVTVVIGVAVNMLFAGGSVWDQLAFRRVSYGSYFVTLGYALALFAIYLALSKAKHSDQSK